MSLVIATPPDLFASRDGHLTPLSHNSQQGLAEEPEMGTIPSSSLDGVEDFRTQCMNFSLQWLSLNFTEFPSSGNSRLALGPLERMNG